MKISLKWLNDFVDIQEYFTKPEALADLLTKAGLEVEEIVSKAKDFQYVVVGLILEKDKHPNADKLSLCRVTTGEGVVHQIVCGAQNHKQNDKIVVALPGAVLPGNFAIKNSVIRGVESGGMLCSDKELGIAATSEGIKILPADAPIGKPLAEYLGLDDVTFELKVTPNRADCLSHYGLAREISCLISKPLKKISPIYKLAENSTKSEVALEVKNSDLCPRYAGRFISGVKVSESPAWLKKRLEVVGLNSINNIVDVTNYVMLELGQPLHAFDADQLKGRKIIVGMATAKEKFKTLDGTEIELKGDELMIRDGERPVAMAGVVGGQNSGVSDSTKNIFLEAAYFTPATVRKSSRGHGVQTDSGYRFSRGVDPDGTLKAMDRAVELMLQVGGGSAYADHYDIYPMPVKKEPLSISVQTVSDRLGYQADAAKLKDYLLRLGCEVKENSGQLEVLPPTFRFDLEQEMDLVEEYARLNGYDQIPEKLPVFEAQPASHDQNYVLSNAVSQTLRGLGFSQALNFAFVAEKSEKKFLGSKSELTKTGLTINEEAIHILNPLNEEMNVMRSSLLTSLYKNLNHNYHQGNEYGRLFEIGQCFYRDSNQKYAEEWRLGMIAWGQKTNLWEKNKETPLVMEIKAAVEAFLKSLHITAYTFEQLHEEGLAFSHRGQTAKLIVEGKNVGLIGSLHPVLLEEDKVRVEGAYAELNLDLILKGQPRPSKVESFSRFPKVERDLALVMPISTKSAAVVAEFKKVIGASLVDLQVFDVYQGDKLPQGQKSVAYRLVLQDKNGTLQDEAINSFISKALDALKTKLNVTVR